MAAASSPFLPLRVASRSKGCIFCQYQQLRYIHITTRQLQQQQQQKQKQHDQRRSNAKPMPSSAPSPSSSTTSSPAPKPFTSKTPSPKNLTNIPRSPTQDRPYIRARDGELVPQPLARPLGLPYAPQAGENTGVDSRSWRQRRDDFASYDKHLERRQSLVKDLFEKNYFRDMGNLGKIHKGKSMLAPSTPFRKEVAMYFPNLRGTTLLGKTQDTTNVISGKVTLVKLMSNDWANTQCDTFVGKTANPALWELLNREEAVTQLAEINVEPSWFKWALVRMSMGRMRKLKEEKQWARYFLVRNGVDDDIKESLGMWNSMVGYIYLLDPQCRIRWASNGDAREDEKKSLVSCLKRLVDEAKGIQRPKILRLDPTPSSSSGGATALP